MRFYNQNNSLGENQRKISPIKGSELDFSQVLDIEPLKGKQKMFHQDMELDVQLSAVHRHQRSSLSIPRNLRNF